MLKGNPITDGRISAFQVEDAIRECFGLGWWTRWLGSRIYISDESYNAVNLNALKAWLSIDDEEQKPYVETDHDCDDFSFQLLGRLHEHDPSLAIGIVWIQADKYAHALNFVVDRQLEFFFVEPQNDSVFNVKPSDWRLILAVI